MGKKLSRLITGYRTLTDEEIDLINEIKRMGTDLDALFTKVHNHLIRQAKTEAEQYAQPARWASIGRTDLQTGLMALTRAVAQPENF